MHYAGLLVLTVPFVLLSPKMHFTYCKPSKVIKACLCESGAVSKWHKLTVLGYLLEKCNQTLCLLVNCCSPVCVFFFFF